MLATGVVAADQLDLLERLTHKKSWAGWRAPTRWVVKQELEYATALRPKYWRLATVTTLDKPSPLGQVMFDSLTQDASDPVRYVRVRGTFYRQGHQ